MEFTYNLLILWALVNPTFIYLLPPEVRATSMERVSKQTRPGICVCVASGGGGGGGGPVK